VIIVGAGLGGCATALAMANAGFEVVVFEKVREFQRLGDSLGLGENAFKLLDRWSPYLRNRLIEIGNKSKYMQIRRWHDGKILAQQPLMDMAGYIGHRGDYHKGFLRAVAEKGVPVHMGMEVSIRQTRWRRSEMMLTDSQGSRVRRSSTFSYIKERRKALRRHCNCSGW
jgi:salicylate hydroxylase